MTFPAVPKNTIDGHVHLFTIDGVGEFIKLRREIGLERMNLLSIVYPDKGVGNSTVLAAKALHPEAFYAFGGLDHAAGGSTDPANALSLARQAVMLRQAGCDGMKMLETKPSVRQERDVPIDSPYYHEYFAVVEEQQIPLLWHVADPEEFWDPKTTPWWALKHNWGYGPSYVPKEKLYSEVANVLNRHPDLKVLFAHMYFLSADLPRLDRFLRTYPNVSIDLALGVELMFNLSKTPQQARDFFLQYQDRIVFGSDAQDIMPLDKMCIRYGITNKFLQRDEVFSIPPEAEELLQTPGEIRGLGLPRDVLAKIYRDNFRRFVGGEPAKVDRNLALDECRRLAGQASRLSGLPVEQTEAGKCIQALEA